MSRVSSLRRYTRQLFSLSTLEQVTLLLATCAFVYELPLSVIVEMLYSFGYVPYDGFVRVRLLLGAALVAAFGANVVLNHRDLLSNRSFIVYAGLIVYMSGVVFLNRAELAYNNDADEFLTTATEYWFPIIFKYLVFFAVGYYLTRFTRIHVFLFVLGVVAALIILQHVDYERLWIDRSLYIPEAPPGNYLFLGDAMALSCLYIIGRIHGIVPRLIFFAASATIILLIGSRTSFAVYLGAVSVWLLVTLRPRSIIPIGVFVGVLLIAYLSVDVDEIASRNPRLLALFGESEDDESYIARAYFSEVAKEDIGESPVFGKFGGQREALAIFPKPSWKTYAHDFSSYWRQFGLPVFLAILYIFYRFARLMLEHFPRRADSAYSLTFLFGMFLIVESVFSRSFAFSVSHIMFGLVVALERSRQTTPAAQVAKPTRVAGTSASGRRRRRRTRMRW